MQEAEAVHRWSPFRWTRGASSASSFQLQELAALDRRARRGDEVEQEAQIMQAQQPQPEDLVLVHEVPDVGAA